MILGIDLVIQNRTGLHARPARELVNLARRFQSDVRVQHGARRANGKSLASLLTLGVQRGSTIRIEVDGIDGEEALRVLAAAVTAGLGESSEAEPSATEAASLPPAAPATGATAPAAVPGSRLQRGVSAAPGLVVGPIYQLRSASAEVGAAAGPAAVEQERLDRAIARAREQLAAARQRVAEGGAVHEAAIFDVHAELLEDPEIVCAVRSRVTAGDGAARAWKTELDERAAAIARVSDPLLAARAGDLVDLVERVLRLLADERAASTGHDEMPAHPVILVAPDLAPSQTTAFEPGRVLGICTAAGGPTSHAAILARALGLPSW